MKRRLALAASAALLVLGMLGAASASAAERRLCVTIYRVGVPIGRTCYVRHGVGSVVLDRR